MLPLIDYSKYFRNNVVIIVGVGRSGTTILGKIMGSMRNTVYLFEPAIMKYLPMLWDKELQVRLEGLHETEEVYPFENYPPSFIEQAFLGTLFEDYILPFIQCRSGMSHDSLDWTWWGHYMHAAEYRERKQLSGRADVLRWLQENKPLFVLKVNESQKMLDVFSYLFYGCQFIHIVRNGFDVISSSIKRGWYTDDSQAIEFADSKKVPLFVNKASRKYWPSYDAVTRAACAWRCLADLNKRSDCWTIRYEDFCDNHDLIAGEIVDRFGLERSDITDRHVFATEQYKQKEKQTITLDMIAEPERNEFHKVMQRLGYIE